MRIAIRSLAMVSSMSLMLTLCSVSLTAQEPKETAPVPPATKKNDPARRVPSYFGQIGLRPEQREEVYKIRAKHLQKITELEARIDAMKTEMLTECEGLLDQTQKQTLELKRKSTISGETAPASKK